MRLSREATNLDVVGKLVGKGNDRRSNAMVRDNAV